MLYCRAVLAAMAEAPAPPAPTYIVASDLTGVQPPAFAWDADDLSAQLRGFECYCTLILGTPSFARRPPTEIVRYILLWMGPRAVEIFDNWTHLSEAQKTDPNQVWAAFRAYFEPKSNFRLARFQLRELTQEAGESIDTFVTRLKVQAGKCNFATPAMLEDNVIDQIIKGTAHSGVRKAMLDHDPAGLTLDRVLDTARTHEATQAQLQKFQRTDRQVDEVRRRSRGQERPQHRQRPRCGNCGGQHHNREVCPAKGQSCHHCHKIGHWAKLCRGKSNESSRQSSRGYKGGRGSFNTRDRRSGQNRHGYTPKRHVHSLESDTLTGDFESLTFNSGQ